MYYVYSITKTANCDAKTSGYVGVTYDFIKRQREHFMPNPGNPSPLRGENPDNWHFELLAICDTKEKALVIEGLYRPTTNIGLNKLAGGSHAGNTSLKGKPSNNRNQLTEAQVGKILQWKYADDAPTLEDQAGILKCSVKTISNYRRNEMRGIHE